MKNARLYLLTMILSFTPYLSSQGATETIKGASYFIIHTSQYCMKYEGDYRWRLCLKPCSRFNTEYEKYCKFCDHTKDRVIQHYIQDGYVIVAYYNQNNEVVDLEYIKDPTKDPALGIEYEEYLHAYIEDAEFEVVRWIKDQLKPNTKLDYTCRPKAKYARITFQMKWGRRLWIFDKSNDCLSEARYGGPANVISREYIKNLESYINFSEMEYIEDTRTFKYRWFGKPTVYKFNPYPL